MELYLGENLLIVDLLLALASAMLCGLAVSPAGRPVSVPRVDSACELRSRFHPAEIPRNIEQQRVNDERQRTRPRRSGRVCAGRWRVVNSLTRKRSEVQILRAPTISKI